MAKKETEGLVLLLDVGESMSTTVGGTSYLQSCVDIIQMIVPRKMFQASKDEIALVLCGTRDTANELWDGSSDHYSHVTVARPLAVVDWNLLEFVQNKLSVSTLQADILDGLVVASNHFHEDANRNKLFTPKHIICFTDFASRAEDEDKLAQICAGLSKHEIRVDVISPYSESDDHGQGPAAGSNGHVSSANDDEHRNNPSNGAKPMTAAQLNNRAIMKEISEQTDGAMYSFGEVWDFIKQGLLCAIGVGSFTYLQIKEKLDELYNIYKLSRFSFSSSNLHVFYRSNKFCLKKIFFF